LSECADEQRFAEAGYAFEETVTADEEARQHTMQNIVVADDDAAQLLMDGLVTIGKLGGTGLDGFG
jgi:hypothetical protein